MQRVCNFIQLPLLGVTLPLQPEITFDFVFLHYQSPTHCMMYLTDLPDFFTTLEADFADQRRSPKKRPMLIQTDPIKDRTRVACSCENKAPLPTSNQSTPVRSSSFNNKRRRTLPVCPAVVPKSKHEPKLTTTIVRVEKQPKYSHEDHFSLHLHLEKFEPWEISVKVLSDKRTLMIRAKHEITADENTEHTTELADDYECIEYLKQVKVPSDVALDQMKCTLEQNGWLQIEAPTMTTKDQVKEQIIPVQVVRKPEKVESSNFEEIVID